MENASPSLSAVGDNQTRIIIDGAIRVQAESHAQIPAGATRTNRTHRRVWSLLPRTHTDTHIPGPIVNECNYTKQSLCAVRGSLRGNLAGREGSRCLSELASTFGVLCGGRGPARGLLSNPTV